MDANLSPDDSQENPASPPPIQSPFPSQISSQPDPLTANQPVSNSKKVPWKLIFILLLVLFILGILGGSYFLFFSKKKASSATINSSSNTPISATQSAAKQTDSICKTITDQLFNAIKIKNVDSIYSLEASEGVRLDKNIISGDLDSNQLRDIVGQTLTSSIDISKDRNRSDPQSTKKYYQCGGLTKYSSVPTGGFFAVILINSDNSWKIFQYTIMRNTIEEFGNVTQDLQGIKTQTGMRLNQPTYLPTGYNYVNTTLITDDQKRSDGQLHKTVTSIFSPHPEQMNSFGMIPDEIMVIQVLGYQPTEKDILAIIKTTNNPSYQPQEVNLDGIIAIYTTLDIEFVKNGTIVTIAADKSITKDELIKIAKSFTEVQ